jgi:hypothetical protein
MYPSRRTFLQGSVAGSLGMLTSAAAAEPKPFAGEVGVTTGSFVKHLATKPQPGKLVMLDLPKIMRDELGMKVIDLMTATLASFDPAYLDQMRNAAEKAGCALTNLKMNLKGFDYDSPDAAVRAKAMAEYKSKLDAAAKLGVRWARPAPGSARPDMAIHVASLRELADYAAERKIQLIIENNGWMASDADAIPNVVKAIDRNLGVSPDTGNWKDNVRYAGLAKAFPLAVSCDFKALKLEPDGSHTPWDLKRCFQIGWDAGFRGPWCLEHFHDTLPGLLKEFGQIRDMLKMWMAAGG